MIRRLVDGLGIPAGVLIGKLGSENALTVGAQG
jgi:hypothetical protein